MWKRLIMMLVAAATLLGLLPAAVSASPPAMYGDWHFAWASKPVAVSYAPSALYSQNPSGDAITINRLNAGTYNVIFEGANLNDGTVHVSAYASSATCSVGSWTGTTIRVNCADDTGAPVNSKFTVLHTNSTDEAYAYAHAPSVGSHAPLASYSNNPGGGATTVFRNAVGRYRVNFDGHNLSGHNVQVTAYNSTAHCAPFVWSGESVSVDCHGPNGNLVDSRFTVLATAADNTSYAWVGDATSASSTPAADHANNPAGGSVQVARTQMGRYSVRFPDATFPSGIVLATAYQSNAVCNTSGWGGDALGVRCYDSSGAPVDSRFSVIHLNPFVFVLPPFFFVCDGQSVTVNIGLGQTPTEGPDVILGTSGDDVIDGLGGDDIICGLGGDDTLRGAKGADRILGGDGNDIIRGMGGADALFGGAGSDRLIGNHRNDLLMGGEGNDFLLGGAGRDRGRGEAGNDTINGGPGPDRLWGDAGDDIVKGQTGNDVLFGGADADRLIGGLGINTLDGGAGPDTCRVDNDSPPEAC
jgi:Ca2+-binding RTX toxin-like protein